MTLAFDAFGSEAFRCLVSNSQPFACGANALNHCATAAARATSYSLKMYMMKGQPLCSGIVQINPEVEVFRRKPTSIPGNTERFKTFTSKINGFFMRKRDKNPAKMYKYISVFRTNVTYIVIGMLDVETILSRKNADNFRNTLTKFYM